MKKTSCLKWKFDDDLVRISGMPDQHRLSVGFSGEFAVLSFSGESVQEPLSPSDQDHRS